MGRLILAVFVSLLCVQLCYSAELSLEASYDKINEHLFEATSDDDVEANMAIARSWLRQLKKEDRWWKKHRGSNRSMIQALSSFLELKDILSSGACNDSSLEVIEKNDKGARMSARSSEKNPVRRIGKIVHHYAKKYHEMCYPDTVTSKFKELDPESRKYVLNMGWGITLRPDPKFVAPYCIRWVHQHIAMDAYTRADGADILSHLSKHKVTQDEFDKYILHPCKELAKKMGEDFSEDTSKKIHHYDKSLSEVNNLMIKRRAVYHCQLTLKFENEIYANMIKLMDMPDWIIRQGEFFKSDKPEYHHEPIKVPRPKEKRDEPVNVPSPEEKRDEPYKYNTMSPAMMVAGAIG